MGELFECLVEEEREVLQEAAELSGELIQRTTSEAPQRRYVLHRTGHSQEDDQLLREGRGWLCASGRPKYRSGLMNSSSPRDPLITLRQTITAIGNDRQPITTQLEALRQLLENRLSRLEAEIHLDARVHQNSAELIPDRR